jgi:hypothetical protein
MKITRNKKNRDQEQDNNYLGIEKEFLNTFFSGIYFSASDLVILAKKIGLDLPIKGREILLKKIVSYSHEKNSFDVLSSELTKMLDDRISEYSDLLNKYNGSQKIILPLITKAQATKKLVLTKIHRSQID